MPVSFIEKALVRDFFFSSRRRHTRFDCDWSSDVCSSDLVAWRRFGGRPAQGTWLWVGAGCLSILLGQAVWTYYRLALHAPPPYPSLADVGYLDRKSVV